MSKAKIYGKNIWEVLETIYDVEEYYCINGMFYIKTKEQEYYFALDVIGAIHIDSESEDKEGKWIEVWDKDHLTILAYKCSECETLRNAKTSYCADCGADMRGEEV